MIPKLPKIPEHVSRAYRSGDDLCFGPDAQQWLNEFRQRAYALPAQCRVVVNLANRLARIDARVKDEEHADELRLAHLEGAANASGVPGGMVVAVIIGAIALGFGAGAVTAAVAK